MQNEHKKSAKNKPIIHNIFKGNWQIIFDQEISWTLYCQHKNDKQIVSKPPIDMVYVDRSCELVSRVATILGGFGGSSKIDILLDNYVPKVKPHIFYESLAKSMNATPIPPLDHLDELPDKWVSLDNIRKITDNLLDAPVNPWYSEDIFAWNWPSLVVLTVFIAIIYVIGVLSYRVFLKRKRNARKVLECKSIENIDVTNPNGGSQLLLDSNIDEHSVEMTEIET